jgi:DEAD/DEAH box helicase domain-containing protein
VRVLRRIGQRLGHREIDGRGDRQIDLFGQVDVEDEGQRRVLLRMREVMATSEDRASRSFDESDGREPKFYDKNMFVLKSDEDVTEAWYLDCDEVPFGFEFFRKITLREVNFGESISATPAIVENTFYLRTANYLWAFGEKVAH